MQLRWVVLPAMLVAGCLASSTVPCGDNVCREGLVCVGDGMCATPDERDACTQSNLPDGAPCSVGAAHGFCDHGACFPTACGNGVIDPGEACDGPADDGTPCSPDCKKLEHCGDGVVDSSETCDDANANPADGCDACVATAWTATALVGGDLTSLAIQDLDAISVAVDGDGNVLACSDTRVLRLDHATGIVTTVAGRANAFGLAAAGDGGLATNALLAIPVAIAVDGLGNVYIADDDRIRQIDDTGVIRTIAGGGDSTADSVDALSAKLVAPRGLLVDGFGGVTIADSGQHRVVRVDPTTHLLTAIVGTATVAGTTGDGGPANAARLQRPVAVALDHAGNLYIADSHDAPPSVEVVRVVDTTNTITTVAGILGSNTHFGGDGKVATSADLYLPSALAVDRANNLYIADAGNRRIRRASAPPTT